MFPRVYGIMSDAGETGGKVKCMNSKTEIRVGAAGTVRSGRSTLAAVVSAVNADGSLTVVTQAGREMRTRSFVPVAADRAKAGGTARAAKAAGAPAARKLSLLGAAAAILEGSDEPLNCRQLVEAAKARGLWEAGAGKTPEQTLYSAIRREIADKGERSRFRMSSVRGHFSFSR